MSGLYVKVPCDWYRQAAMVHVGPMAQLLHLRATAYAKEQLTDGIITAEQLPVIGFDMPDIYELAERLSTPSRPGAEPLWECTDSGWYLQGYLDDHPSAADVQAIRVARREAGRAGGRARGRTAKEEMPDDGVEPDGGDIPNPLTPDPAFDAQALAAGVTSKTPVNRTILQAVAARLHVDPVIAQQIGHQLTSDECGAILGDWARTGKPAQPQSLIPGGPNSMAPWGDPWWAVRLRDGLGGNGKGNTGTKRDEQLAATRAAYEARKGRAERSGR